MNPTAISLLSALAAAAWSVWTWKSERQKEREVKRDEMSAQYVNSLLLIAQDLQRRLYRILEEDELALYRQEYPEPCVPASPHAIDLLFYLSQFFGWQLMTYRFGPYTRDPRMISIMAQIGEIMESRTDYPGEAFRFTLSDRHALGHAALRRTGESASRPAFVAISRFEFAQAMANKQSEHAQLFQSKAVRCTLAAIDRAGRAADLEGRERLAMLQNLIVDLLSYLEHEEGFLVHFGPRGRATVEATQEGSVSTSNAQIRILHQMPGRIRLQVTDLHKDKTGAAHLQSQLETLNHIRSVRINVDAACIVVEYAADIPQADLIPAVVAVVANELGRSSINDRIREPGGFAMRP